MLTSEKNVLQGLIWSVWAQYLHYLYYKTSLNSAQVRDLGRTFLVLVALEYSRGIKYLSKCN